MTEHPILFSAPMVRAILDGSKTQTRRIVKPHPIAKPFQIQGEATGDWFTENPPHLRRDKMFAQRFRCPYGLAGDRLWVREAWLDAWAQNLPHTSVQYHYRADLGNEHYRYRWSPSIHMPRAASRISLAVTEVRVQRLQDISEEDAKAEGIVPVTAPNGHITYQVPGELAGQTPQRAFKVLWEGINGNASWAANPWVWAISFRVEKSAEMEAAA
jgi:hypothetical protein